MKTQIDVIALDQAAKWSRLVTASSQADIHFMPSYLSWLQTHYQGTAKMWCWRQGSARVLLPYIERIIKVMNPRSKRRIQVGVDLVSPWYYGGPLCVGKSTPEQSDLWVNDFIEFCRQKKYVSGFFRCHPYVNNQMMFKKKFDIKPIGLTVWVDLTRGIEGLLAGFKASARNKILKSLRSPLEISYQSDKKTIEQFQELYNQSMNQKKANNFYYFDADALSDLKHRLKDGFWLVTIKKNQKMVAGSVFITGRDKMYYFLSARNRESDKYGAMNRIVFEAMKLGIEANKRMLDLGGGPPGSSLLDFKMNFSSKTKKLWGWNLVIDAKKYTQITKLAGGKHKLRLEKAINFPEYRYV